MDDVTAETLQDRLATADGAEETLAALVAATKAQIKCQHSLGCRLRAMDQKLCALDRSLDERIDQRIAVAVDKKFDDLSALIRSCPARNSSGSGKPIPRGLGIFRGAALKDLIIFILAAAVAAMAGLNVNHLLGG